MDPAFVEAATKVREIEKADHDATHTDYSESIDALERAIVVLKNKMRVVQLKVKSVI